MSIFFDESHPTLRDTTNAFQPAFAAQRRWYSTGCTQYHRSTDNMSIFYNRNGCPSIFCIKNRRVYFLERNSAPARCAFCIQGMPLSPPVFLAISGALRVTPFVPAVVPAVRVGACRKASYFGGFLKVGRTSETGLKSLNFGP